MLGLVFLIGFVRDDRHSSTLPCMLTIGVAGIALVTNGSAGLDVQKNGIMRCIPFLPSSQIKAKRIAIEVCFQMDFGRETTL